MYLRERKLNSQDQNIHQVPIPEEFRIKQDKAAVNDNLPGVFTKPLNPADKNARSWKSDVPKERHHYYFSTEMLERVAEKNTTHKINNMSRTIEILAIYALNVLDANKKNEKTK